MKQQELKALLKEAANPKCSWKRRNEIQCFLNESMVATGDHSVHKTKSREDGINLILDTLYMSTLENRPQLLPTFFPVFAIICGDRKNGRLIAEVDWSIVD